MTTAELRALGCSKTGIARRVAAGRLHPWHHGAYLFGSSRPTKRGRCRAAVAAIDEHAALSHHGSADLEGVRSVSRSSVDVTIATRNGRGHAGITVHRVRHLHPDDVIDDDGIRRTSWARTLLDLAGVLRSDALQKAIRRLDALRLLDLQEVDACVARNPGRREAPVLVAALVRYRPRDHTEHERLVYELCLRASFDEPERNRATAGFERSMEIDLRWPERRLCIEADGREFHDTTDAFHEDRRKDRALRIGGWLVFRFTWEDVTTRREQTLRELRAIERMTRSTGGR